MANREIVVEHFRAPENFVSDDYLLLEASPVMTITVMTTVEVRQVIELKAGIYISIEVTSESTLKAISGPKEHSC